MSSANDRNAGKTPPRYVFNLPNGETIGGTAAEFPALIEERLRMAQDDPERALLLRALMLFLAKTDPKRLAAENWSERMACIEDLTLRARMMLVTGCELEIVKDFTAAAAVYRQAILMEPLDADVWYYCHNNLGFSLNQLGDFVGGEAFCREALRISTTLPNAYKNLALALQGQGRWVEAARFFIDGTLAYPRDTRSFNHLRDLIAEHPEIRRELPTLDEDIARCECAIEDAAR
jgi:tetratricopeptide (TPR) repeat protein